MNPSFQIRNPLILAASLPLLFASVAVAVDTPRSLPDCFRPEQLKWHLNLGTHQYTIPLVDRGRLYVGINDVKLEHPAVNPSGGGILLCLDEETGQQIWQLPIPRYMEGKIEPFHFNHWKCGVCSRPAVEGDRLYIVAPRGDILCIDRNGQADGNDGPFLDDARYMGVVPELNYELRPSDGDIIWQYNLIKQSHVVPHDVCGSSPLVHGDFVYACTSNGVDGKHDHVPHPEAPSLVVLDKLTGRLAATDGALVGERTLHGQWSSPVAAQADGSTLILFGGGDGILYAFEPWGQPATSEAPGTLKLAWRHDCCPADYRQRDGQPVSYSRWNEKRSDGPSEIIATPVVYEGRAYVAIGQSPLHGAGKGLLSCVDVKTGALVWESRTVDRTLSNVALHEGLLFVPDYTGRLHCFDADTGEHLWSHELGSGVWSASPVIHDGKLYIGTENKAFWVIEAARKPNVVFRGRVRSMSITPGVSGSLMFLPTQTELFALDLR